MLRMLGICMVFMLSLGAQSFPMTKEQVARALAVTLANGVPNLPIDVEILTEQLQWDPNTALRAHNVATEVKLREIVVRLRLAVNGRTVADLSAEDLKRAMWAVTLDDVLETLERRDNDANLLARPK